MIKKYQKKNGTTAYMFKAYLGIDPSTGKRDTPQNVDLKRNELQNKPMRDYKSKYRKMMF